MMETSNKAQQQQEFMARYADSRLYSPLLGDALKFAAEAHAKQLRKDKQETPCISHLMRVAGIACAMSGKETVTIAACLHDILEDTDTSPDTIYELFGDEVLYLIEYVSADSNEEYLRGIVGAPRDAILISLADKLDNWRDGYRHQPELVKPETLEFYRHLIEIYEFRLGGDFRWLKELKELLA